MNKLEETKPADRSDVENLLDPDVLKQMFINRLFGLGEGFDNVIFGFDVEGVLRPFGNPRTKVGFRQEQRGTRGRIILTNLGMELLDSVAEEAGKRNILSQDKSEPSFYICTASENEYAKQALKDKKGLGTLNAIQFYVKGLVKKKDGGIYVGFKKGFEKKTLFIYFGDIHTWDGPPVDLLETLSVQHKKGSFFLINTPILRYDGEMGRKIEPTPQEFWKHLYRAFDYSIMNTRAMFEQARERSRG